MWKFVCGAEGSAQFPGADIQNLPAGWWTFVHDSNVRRLRDGTWVVNKYALDIGVVRSQRVAVLHDLAGDWRVLVPHQFDPERQGNVADSAWLVVSHAYQRIALSRKVRTIYEAPSHGGLG